MTCGHETKQDWCPICTTRDDLLAKIARLEAKIKRRVPRAKYNALQEECDGRMVAIKQMEAKISELQAVVDRLADTSNHFGAYGLAEELNNRIEYAKPHATEVNDCE